MSDQSGSEAITHDDLYRVRICPRGDQWIVSIHSKRTLSSAETALDTNDHTASSLDSAKEWVAEQLARIWLPALEERHDLRKYEDLTWTPVDC